MKDKKFEHFCTRLAGDRKNNWGIDCIWNWRVPIIDVSRGVAGVAGKVNKQKPKQIFTPIVNHTPNTIPNPNPTPKPYKIDPTPTP